MRVNLMDDAKSGQCYELFPDGNAKAVDTLTLLEEGGAGTYLGIRGG